MGQGNPVTILEADIFFALESAPDTAIWMGGCAEKITLTEEFKELEIEYSGIPDPVVKQVASSHVIEIGNLWLINTDVPESLPRLRRGEVYRMVITFLDEETLYFATRTYEGVIVRSQRVDAPNQNVVLRASTMAETAGLEVAA